MEDEKKELEIFKDGISYLKKALECFKDCNDENITLEEFEDIEEKLYIFEDRAMKLEIDISGCILEEV